MHIRSILVAAALLSSSLAARADMYNFTITDSYTGIFSTSGTLNVNTASPTPQPGGFSVSAITGTGIEGLIGANGFGSNGNLFYPAGTSYLDNNGLAFVYQNAFGQFDVLIYSLSPGAYNAYYREINTATPNSNTVPVSFTADLAPTAVATPEPSSLLLLATGTAGLFGVARHKLFA